ncbi:MAG: ribosomal protein S18-alanine N-acetyltransferase [Ornithinimicrobium sp.]
MTTHEHAIRLMTWADLAAVAALEARIYPDTAWTVGTWWAELAERPRRYYVVADVPGQDAEGTVLGGYAGLDVSGDNADVMTIAVDAAHRGTGLGRALLDSLHSQAGDRGVSAVLLEVRADNDAARALYAQAGYRAIHTRVGYYQPDDVDAVVLRAALGPS